jgi:phosphonate transport system substrate-binding protein
VLVVRPDSAIRALEDLKGARAAWVDPLSAAGYVLPRGQLHARGLAPEGLFADERFLGSHPAALEAVRKGEADVAGTHGSADEAGLLVQQGKPDPSLRVLATFGGIPADVIAAKKGLSDDVRAKVAQAFVLAGEDEAMRPLARAVFGATSFCLGGEASYAGWHRALPAALASGLLVASDADDA